GPPPVHETRCTHARAAGRLDEARKWYGAWSAAERDSMSDCLACDQNVQVEYLVELGEDENALQRAEPILSGRMRCAEIPQVTLGTVLLPLVRLGRIEEAARHHLKGARLVARNPEF